MTNRLQRAPEELFDAWSRHDVVRQEVMGGSRKGGKERKERVLGLNKAQVSWLGLGCLGELDKAVRQQG